MTEIELLDVFNENLRKKYYYDEKELLDLMKYAYGLSLRHNKTKYCFRKFYANIFHNLDLDNIFILEKDRLYFRFRKNLKKETKDMVIGILRLNGFI